MVWAFLRMNCYLTDFCQINHHHSCPSYRNSLWYRTTWITFHNYYRTRVSAFQEKYQSENYQNQFFLRTRIIILETPLNLEKLHKKVKKVASESKNPGRNYWSRLQKPLSDKNLLFLSQKFTYGHHPTGTTPHDFFKTRNEV